MSQKNQIYLLATGCVLLAGSTAFFAYQNHSIKNQLATWWKANDASKANFPVDLANALNKITAV